MMSASAQWHKQSDHLALTGEVDFDNVVALLGEAEDWLKTSSSTQCALDLAGVVYTNSAGIALIMSLHRRAHALDKQLTLHHVPTNLISMAHLSGLEWLIDHSSEDPLNKPANPLTPQ
jgi:anti-anti-sigma factor